MMRCAFVLASATAASLGPRGEYSREQELLDGVTLFWRLSTERMFLALETTVGGWIGLGIAEVGGMIGSDIVFVHEVDGEWAVVDSHSTSKSVPTTDTIQDWELVSRSEFDGNVTVELSRALEPCDPQDRPIENDGNPTKIVVAHGGASKTIGYHHNSRASTLVNFFDLVPDPFVAIKRDVSVKTMEFHAHNLETAAAGYEIPVPGTSNAQTTYVDFCFPVTNAGHIVAVDALLNPETAQFVHHFVLKGVKGQVGPDCSTVHPLRKYCDSGFYQRYNAAQDVCPSSKGYIVGCEDKVCASSLQSFTATDLKCMSALTSESVNNVWGMFHEVLSQCNETSFPAATELYHPCEETVDKFDDAYAACISQDCSHVCVSKVEATTEADIRECLADIHFQGHAGGAVEWMINNMYSPCGGTGVWENVSAITPGVQARQMDDIWGWAPGTPAMVLPADVGIAFGSAGSYDSIGVQIHYDNPEEKSGVVDSSGIILYFTETPREKSAGMLQLGDKFVRMTGQLVKPASIESELVEHTLHCPSEATEAILENSSITIMDSGLHMHEEGFWMATTVRDRNGDIKAEFKTEYYDGAYQGRVIANVDIAAGDSFTTRCVYKPKAGAIFGLGSNEEMCIDFLMYFPVNERAQSLFGGACGYEKVYTTVGKQLASQGFQFHTVQSVQEASLGRRFDRNSSECVPNSEATGVATESGGNTEISSASFCLLLCPLSLWVVVLAAL
mmetsp:Transcript_34045/g.72297  ORF Transcript_34045/g.72297 Transcript_34045/m.72297 type:complete len:730 (+) Transcript_34045:62-2251(+)